MKATELISKLQNTIDKHQKDFDVEILDLYGDGSNWEIDYYIMDIANNVVTIIPCEKD